MVAFIIQMHMDYFVCRWLPDPKQHLKAALVFSHCVMLQNVMTGCHLLLSHLPDPIIKHGE